uniref:NADH dehydrogenase subunit 6 n=1 Tax=Glaucias dorsalis TaxID=2880902 RepID=UPI001D10C945|nr:NADH dehydrogenase subunit 6 [Glaucias dorsalis]UCC46010.1 NADH dehydrogenase subunit 6 [Glaucias dorsalis]
MKLMMALMINISLILMMLNHPLSMGLILIIQTVITAMMVGYMMNSFLFSYIIIIIMLSGMLVLFIYMASVASNEKFKFPMKSLFIIMSLSTFIYFFTVKNPEYLNSLMMNEEFSLIKTFNTSSAKITLMMIIYLLLTMIAVSNIAKTTDGPLRMNSNYE